MLKLIHALQESFEDGDSRRKLQILKPELASKTADGPKEPVAIAEDQGG